MDALSHARLVADTTKYFDTLSVAPIAHPLKEIQDTFCVRADCRPLLIRERPAYRPTFGFHGLGNMWRYMPDSEVLEIVDQVDPMCSRACNLSN